MAQTDTRPDTRARIIEGAKSVVRERGPGALTLEAAASKAGVSKGGLLYHFPTKDFLITGMIEDALAAFEADVEAQAALEPEGPGAWLRAFVTQTFAAHPEHDPSASILAAAASNPDLLEPVSLYFDRWHERSIEDGSDPITATIVRLASDGLWFADMFTSTSPQGKDREELLERLLDMIGTSAELHSGKGL